jgi:hypothetical protein
MMWMENNVVGKSSQFSVNAAVARLLAADGIVYALE